MTLIYLETELSFSLDCPCTATRLKLVVILVELGSTCRISVILAAFIAGWHIAGKRADELPNVAN